MMRHLPTLVLSAILGSTFLVGNAEACHGKRKCATPTVCAVAQPAPCPQPVVCAKPKRAICVKIASCPKPVVCASPVAKCGPKFKLCNFSLPKLCHKKPAACGPVVACAAPVSYAAVYPAPQAIPTPQH